MPLIDVRANIDCDVCGTPYSVVLDHAQEKSPWEVMLEEIDCHPYDNGSLVEDEFLCHACLRAFDAALTGDENAVGDVLPKECIESYREWRLDYQSFLDSVEASSF